GKTSGVPGGGMDSGMGGGMGGVATVDHKAYRIDYSKRRLRAELYAVQLALGKKKKGTKADEPVEGQLKGLWFYVKSVDATNPTPEQVALDKIQGPVEEV